MAATFIATRCARARWPAAHRLGLAAPGRQRRPGQGPAERERQRPHVRQGLHRGQDPGGPAGLLGAGREGHARQRDRHPAQGPQGRLGDLGSAAPCPGFRAGHGDGRLEHDRRRIHAVGVQFAHHRQQHQRHHGLGLGRRVRAGAVQVRRDHRDQARLLAGGRVPAQGLRVGPDRHRRRGARPDPQHGPPRGEHRTLAGPGRQPARQPVQALGDRLGPGGGQRMPAASALTPVIRPAAAAASGSGSPPADRWCMASASRSTPLMPARRPGAVTSSSRKARRLSPVGGTPAAASRPGLRRRARWRGSPWGVPPAPTPARPVRPSADGTRAPGRALPPPGWAGVGE